MNTELRGLIRRKIFDGSLREDVAHEAYGGISHGSHCAACGHAIDSGRSEIQVFGADGSHRRYHPQCHLVLSTELEALTQA